ncbi:hypothetical protein OH77DRAFT_1511890 [Trametes cingulata]|nr:hypothetical protein OH77DRAFT_1511890 [Trametes cingulata]
MGEHVRIFREEGFNDPGRRDHARAEFCYYSDELRALCEDGAEGRLPDPPTRCTRCKKASQFKPFMTYKEGLAGAIGLECLPCGDVHWPLDQGDPPPEQLTKIESQRQRDRERSPKAGRRTRKRWWPPQWWMRKLNPPGQERHEQRSESATRKKRYRQDRPDISGNLFSDVSNGRRGLPTVPEETEEPPSASATANTREVSNITIALWWSDGETPQSKEVCKRAGDRICLSDYVWIMARVDAPWVLFEVWCYLRDRWRTLAYHGDILDVDPDADLLLVQLSTVSKCAGLGMYVNMLQTKRLGLHEDHSFVSDLMRDARLGIEARPTKANTVWLVFWDEDDGIPHILCLPVADGRVDLRKNDGLLSFTGVENVDVWTPALSSWRCQDPCKPFYLPAACATLLVRTEYVSRLYLFGLELELLQAVGRVISAPEEDDAGPGLSTSSIRRIQASFSSVASVRSRSPCIQSPAGPSQPAGRDRATAPRRSPSIEFVERPSQGLSLKRAAVRARSPSIEFVEGPSTRKRKAHVARSPSIEFVEGPLPRKRKTVVARSPSIEFVD